MIVAYMAQQHAKTTTFILREKYVLAGLDGPPMGLHVQFRLATTLIPFLMPKMD